MFAIIALALINGGILYSMNTNKPVQPSEPSAPSAPVATKEGTPGGWTIYGTMGCGWTRKQLDYMKKNNKPFTFVDCDNQECPGVEGFPTMMSPSGEKVVGYKEV